MNPKPRSSATPKPKRPGASTSKPKRAAGKAKAAAKPPRAKPAPLAPQMPTKAAQAPRKVLKAPKSTTPAPKAEPLAFLKAPGVEEPATPATPSQVAFVNEYLKDMNGTAAYRRVHPEAKISTCAVEAHRTLRNPKIRALIEAERQKLTERFGLTKEQLIADLVAIVRADPAELSQLRHISCGKCWGGEEGQGRWSEPDPDCESCLGEGMPEVFFADTRKLSPGAKALFVSVEKTRNGLKIHTESKAEARDKLAKILGAYELDNTQKVNPRVELLKSMSGSALPVVKNAGRDGD